MLTEVAKYNCRYSSPGASSTFDSTRWNAAKWSSRMLPVLKTTNSYASRHHNVRHCHPLAVRQSLLCVWAHIYIWQFQKRHGVSIATSESRVRYRRWPHSTREASAQYVTVGCPSVRPCVCPVDRQPVRSSNVFLSQKLNGEGIFNIIRNFQATSRESHRRGRPMLHHTSHVPCSVCLSVCWVGGWAL